MELRCMSNVLPSTFTIDSLYLYYVNYFSYVGLHGRTCNIIIVFSPFLSKLSISCHSMQEQIALLHASVNQSVMRKHIVSALKYPQFN